MQKGTIVLIVGCLGDRAQSLLVDCGAKRPMLGLLVLQQALLSIPSWTPTPLKGL